MRYQEQKNLLKRLLKYTRRNLTDVRKAHIAALEGRDRATTTCRLLGKREAWEQMQRYMESLMKELGAAIPEEDDGS